jgi:pSer/pThr/pTyr-binding forkhead associated (FHA) protein
MAAVAPSAFPVQSVADLQARFEAERAGTPFLLFQDEHGRQQIVGLENEPAEIPIGRDPEIGIPLPWDRQVSRVHALLHRVAGAWTILDDGLSRNGTLVNGERLSGRRRLHDRDVVRCGDVQIEFREPSAAEGEETHRAPAEEALAGRRLSPAQRRVLVALCRPLRESGQAHPATNKAIAAELSLSVDAVKTHLRRLAVLLEVENLPQNRKRAQLAWNALSSGLVSERELLGG